MIKHVIFIAAVCCCSALAVAEPVEIESDSLTLEHAQNRAEFTGSVVLQRGDFKLYCDRLKVYYSQRGESELDKAKAYGHVRIMQDDKRGSSDAATFRQKEGIVILTGNARFEGSDGVIQGEEIVHHMSGYNTRVVKGEASGRARMHIEQDAADQVTSPQESPQ